MSWYHQSRAESPLYTCTVQYKTRNNYETPNNNQNDRGKEADCAYRLSLLQPIKPVAWELIYLAAFWAGKE